MNKYLKITVLTVGIFSCLPTLATPASTNLGSCLVDTLNGKERKNLAKWVFFSMGAHPEIKPYLNITSKEKEASDKYVGELLTKILTVDCPKELSAAKKADPRSIAKAFELVGKVAMQELMSNEKVMKSITNYGKYTDQKKIEKVLSK